MSDTRGKELVLAPGTYAYMQDTTKGQIKVFTGPTVINQTAQEVPVIYDPKRGRFERCERLEQAVCQSPIAVEGYYLVLLNPSADANGQPDAGLAGKVAPALDVGRRINIAGPCMFPLWPGQTAWHVRGHHLRSNQYLLVRVYNEEEARRSWAEAVVKPASGADQAADGGEPASVDGALTARVPDDLTVGKQLIIRGTEVSFYIPPTGVSVVQDGEDGAGRPRYVRDALTLERLEYCILVDEDGNKRYERGPEVVFPEPSERFVTSAAQQQKFRAIELNEIQGLHVKVIAPYEVDGVAYREGDELFITGRETAIYYPREEHSLISYDGRSKHFATAIPAGEARYEMDRVGGEIEMVHGPKMLLPDPRTKVIVRRVLSDDQVQLWYPGNEEALGYNRHLRQLLKQVPTTRTGAISEGDYARGSRGDKKRQRKMERRGMVMEQSHHGAADSSLVADEFVRASTYTQPRSITLYTKYESVPSVDLWTGYAAMVVSKTGARHVERGPKTVLLDYDESLEVLELSTGTPKAADVTCRTVYLRVSGNRVSDAVRAETADQVAVTIELAYMVGFEGEPARWFEVDNYVQLLCDRGRSLLKRAVRQVRIAELHQRSGAFVREALLGAADASGARPGLAFAENGMRVADLDVVAVKVEDQRIHGLLAQAQAAVVKSSVELSSAEHDLEVTRRMEQVQRELLVAKAETDRRKHALAAETVQSALALSVAQLEAEQTRAEGQRVARAAHEQAEDVSFDAKLARQRREADQQGAIAEAEQSRQLAALRAEVEAAVQRFTAAQGGFSEALLALSSDQTVVKVAEALSVQSFIGGKSFTDVVGKLFADGPLEPVLKRITARTERE